MDEDQTAHIGAEGISLPNIASRVLNRPLLLHPAKVEVVLDVLSGRLGVGTPAVAPAPDASRFFGTARREDGAIRPYRVVGSTAIIGVLGSLVNRGAWIGASSGLVSYEGLAAQLSAAQADPDVDSVILDLDSPGGEAAGMDGIAERVRALGAVKPVVAFVNDMAASAAYGIASAAREIVVSPTSIVGSIGVVIAHFDRSEQMEKLGVKATLIHAGEHKVDGHPFGPLPDGVKADLRAEVETIYEQFVGLVARGRAGLSADQVRATEARTFTGQDAIDRGLADRIATFEAILEELSTQARRAAIQRSGFAMSNSTTQAAAPQAENAGITQEAHDAAVNAAMAEGERIGAAAERERIAGILGHEAAEGRDAQARAIALETDMTADQAAKVLAASPKASAVASLEQRAAEAGAEFGSAPKESAAAAADAVWDRAVKQANGA